MNEKNQSSTQQERSKNKLQIPWIIGLVGSLMLVVTLFLPVGSMNGTKISLFGIARLCITVSDLGIAKGLMTEFLVIIIALALFVGLTTLFSALKKPVAAIIFNLLSLVMFQMNLFDFSIGGVSKVIFYIGVVAVMVGAILLLIVKKQNKVEKV